MYTRSKYLVGEIQSEIGFLDQTTAVIFPETIGHDDVAKLFVPGTIRSGGFCHIDEKNQVAVYGKSISLNVQCDEKIDKKLVERALGLCRD